MCELVDPTTLTRYPQRPIEFYLDHERRLALGSLRVSMRFFNGRAPLPRAPDELVALIQNIHQALFIDAEPDLAGRLRGPGQPVWFGGEGQHQIEGAAPDQIEAQLTALLRRFPVDQLATMWLEDLAHHCAVFLEAFFRTHPFLDGNGRVARLFLELAVYRESNHYRLRALGKGRKYRRALEYAHRHVPASLDPLKLEGHRNPWCILARWIEEFIDLPPRELEEVPPDWSTWEDDPDGTTYDEHGEYVVRCSPPFDDASGEPPDDL